MSLCSTTAFLEMNEWMNEWMNTLNIYSVDNDAITVICNTFLRTELISAYGTCILTPTAFASMLTADSSCLRCHKNLWLNLDWNNPWIKMYPCAKFDPDQPSRLATYMERAHSRTHNEFYRYRYRYWFFVIYFNVLSGCTKKIGSSTKC